MQQMIGMASRRTAVYAGTFDVLTNGHVWMIKQGAALFDKLVVAIGENPAKRPLFSIEERLGILREAAFQHKNVSVDKFAGKYLIDYAKQVDAKFILRGIRNQNDYLYEHAMRNVNHDIDASITTVILMPPRELSEISSSMVKGLVGPVGWEDVVARYVPQHVLEMLKAKHG